MSDLIQQVYKTADGSIFDSLEDAKEYVEQSRIRNKIRDSLYRYLEELLDTRMSLPEGCRTAEIAYTLSSHISDDIVKFRSILDRN